MGSQPHPLLEAHHSPERITIGRRGGASPLVVQNAKAGKRPFIHPIIAPDGDGTLTEDAPSHHPWQHGLYVGLNDVNRIGFWSEGLVNNPADGSFRPHPLSEPVVEGQRASWQVKTDWLDPVGKNMLTETQAWSLHDLGRAYELDLVWTLSAKIDLKFGRSDYGGLFIRMPFRGTGSVLTSEGVHEQSRAEAQRARWVAIAMPIPDRNAADKTSGVAMMDHPSNPEHPVPWRVDGQLGIAPSRSIAGAWGLQSGKQSTSQYRVLVYPGPSSADAIEASWARFVR